MKYRIFKTNTILKHLSHSKDCKAYYSELELKDLEHKSEKYSKEKKSKLQSNIYYWHDQRLRQIDKKIDSAIKAIGIRETDEEGWKSYKKCNRRIFLKFKAKISKVKTTLKEKCTHMKTERMNYWDTWLFDEITEYLPLSYKTDLEERISDWRAEITEEIKSTYKHLNNEIRDTVDPYWNDVGGVMSIQYDKDEIHFSKWQEQLHYLKSRRTLRIDFAELWNYIDFRHNNSYELILEKTMSLANEIKSKMLEPFEFPHYGRLKNQYDLLKDIPQAYKQLDNHHEIFSIKHLENTNRWHHWSDGREFIITETNEYFPYKDCKKCKLVPTYLVHHETTKCK